MPYKQDLTDIVLLRKAAAGLSSEQLEKLREWVKELIDERANLVHQRVSERHQKDMRAQMAKAGISWEDFQAALK